MGPHESEYFEASTQYEFIRKYMSKYMSTSFHVQHEDFDYRYFNTLLAKLRRKRLYYSLPQLYTEP
jgi:hypothetical protein